MEGILSPAVDIVFSPAAEIILGVIAVGASLLYVRVALRLEEGFEASGFRPNWLARLWQVRFVVLLAGGIFAIVDGTIRFTR